MKRILLAYVLLLWGYMAHAVVIDQDWKTPGDANALYDTETGMRWLDLSMTADLSHDRVVANLGPGGRFNGFRLATQAEVLVLWANAGIFNTERVWVTYQYPTVNDLVNRLGPTTMVEGGGYSCRYPHDRNGGRRASAVGQSALGDGAHIRAGWHQYPHFQQLLHLECERGGYALFHLSGAIRSTSGYLRAVSFRWGRTSGYAAGR